MNIIYSFFIIKKYIFLILFVIKAVENTEFKDILKLSNGGYFIILDNYFYIYDKDFSMKQSKEFSKFIVIKQSKISEFKNNDDTYIICLLFLFDSYLKKYYVYLYDYNLNKITLANEYDHDFSGNKLDEENICIKNDIIYNYEDDHLKLNLIKIEDSFEYEEEEKTESFDFEFICYNLNINNKNNNNELLGDCESNCHIFSDSSTIRCFFYKGNFLIIIIFIIYSFI